MKVLVISDVHLKPEIFDRAEKIIESGQADMAVQMGDIVDDWGEQFNIPLYEKTLARMVKFQNDHPDTLWVMGNHDYGYYYPNMGVRESGHSRFAEVDVRTWLDDFEKAGGEQKIVHIVDGVIFTHAGLTRAWVERRLEKTGYREGVIPAEENLTHIVNHSSQEELWHEDSPIWARPQYDKWIMWPAKLQVVGHTPVETPIEDSGVLSTDTFSTYSSGGNIGDRSFVIVDTQSGEWETIKEDGNEMEKEKDDRPSRG